MLCPLNASVIWSSAAIGIAARYADLLATARVSFWIASLSSTVVGSLNDCLSDSSVACNLVESSISIRDSTSESRSHGVLNLCALVAGEFVHLDVVLAVRQHLQLVVKGTPLGVDNHVGDTLSLELLSHVVRDLLDVLELLVVGTVGSCTENTANKSGSLLIGSSVRSGQQCSDGIVCQGRNGDRDFKGIQMALEHFHNVLANTIWDIEPFGPSKQSTSI
ncbi:hypothetical protein OGAPHI_003718 [Ogataea philodendri]|uniref:Uncharacterized protein n=1 Tax=Ogataea philodendri TaxID=1378263 RepID=A0A9P8P5X0_9ASCO|nr:uncharacterized protein OGAPHI_003718 [Ogataea philodendri]KAH3665532.1 hypothetical protein OGAPHI_003718 [Ogataea philodendri]